LALSLKREQTWTACENKMPRESLDPSDMKEQEEEEEEEEQTN
jgi:hypothetical protein